MRTPQKVNQCQRTDKLNQRKTQGKSQKIPNNFEGQDTDHKTRVANSFLSFLPFGKHSGIVIRFKQSKNEQGIVPQFHPMK